MSSLIERALQKSKTLRKIGQLSAGILLDLPFRPISDQIGMNSRQQRIPPIVFQTWETRTVGRRHYKSLNLFRRVNSDMSFRLFTSHDRDYYMKTSWGQSLISEVYFRSTFGTLKADIFRYCIVYEYGGYYLDISKSLAVKLSSLHRSDAEGLLSFEKNVFESETRPIGVLHPDKLVIQWAFGFEPKHRLLLNHIQRIENHFPKYLGQSFSNPKLAILNFTGPNAFTKTLHDYAKFNDTSRITQVDPDFNELGVFSMPGAGARYLQVPSYAESKHQAILL